MVDTIGPSRIRPVMKSGPVKDEGTKGRKRKETSDPEDHRMNKPKDNNLGSNIDERC